MNTKEIIELHFNMPFKRIVEDLNRAEGFSVLWLSKQCGFSRDTLYRLAEAEGLSFCDASMAAVLRKKHHTHWATGLRKETSDFAYMHSERMKKNNPSKKRSVREKRAKTMHIRGKIWPQEIAFAKILDRFSVPYVQQQPIGPYNMDFFLPELSLCIEIDSRDKWDKSRVVAARKRDRLVLRRGIRTLRINKKLLDRQGALIQILKTHYIIV